MLKEAGLGLDTIRSLAVDADRATRQEILRTEAEALRTRIAAAQASLEIIEGGLTCEYEDVSQCPNYRRAIAERVGSQVPTDGPARCGEPPARHAWRGGRVLDLPGGDHR